MTRNPEKRFRIVKGSCPCGSTARTESQDMQSVTLSPSDISPVFGHDLGDKFIVVTSPAIRPFLHLEPACECDVIELPWTGPAARRDLVATFRELERAGLRFTALWLADDEFDHYQPDELGRGRLAALSYF